MLRPFFALIGASALAASTGCSDTAKQPIAPTTHEEGVRSLYVEIAGPRELRMNGVFWWHAVVGGAAEPVEYEWEVVGASPGYTLGGDNGAFLGLVVDRAHGMTFELAVTVRAGDRVARDIRRVAFCPTRFPVDDCSFWLEPLSAAR